MPQERAQYVTHPGGGGGNGLVVRGKPSRVYLVRRPLVGFVERPLQLRQRWPPRRLVPICMVAMAMVLAQAHARARATPSGRRYPALCAVLGRRISSHGGMRVAVSLEPTSILARLTESFRLDTLITAV